MGFEFIKENRDVFYSIILLFFVLITIFSSACTDSSKSSVSQNSSSQISASQSTIPQTHVTAVTTSQSQYQKNMAIIKGIVENYHATHMYTLSGMFVCAQMAQDVWDMVETQGITAKLEVGNVNQKVSTIQGADHVWVLAEVTPNQWVAMETTGGFLACPDTNFCTSDNPLYFYGWDYASPKDLQSMFCGANQICSKNSVCINDQCRSCNSGYVMGKDLQCHPSCGGSNNYCTGNSVCLNGQCRSCDPGYIPGQDLLCHPICGNGYCTGNSVCVNGQCRGCNTGYYLGTDLQCHKS